ncbi:MAG: BON domain-containing protein [Janthinobacterium lividum]
MQTRFSGRIVAVTVGAMLAAFLTAGCHDDNPPAPTVVNTPPASSTTVVPSGTATTVSSSTPSMVPDTKVNTNAGPGGSTGTDSALADQVNTAIVHNKQMTGARVEVLATAGVVTLNGQVQNQQQKGLAQTTAQQVPGVSSIKNKLIIVTTGGAKPKPTVVTKTVVIHDQAPAAPSSTASPDASQTPPVAPDQTTPTAPPTGGTTTPQATTGTTGQ